MVVHVLAPTQSAVTKALESSMTYLKLQLAQYRKSCQDHQG